MFDPLDALLADHKMINKLIGILKRDPGRRRLPETLSRAVLSHAWFEDNVFFPSFRSNDLADERFVEGVIDEHKDIDRFMRLIWATPRTQRKLWDSRVLQFEALMKEHFDKEEMALFPLARQILSKAELQKVGEELRRRQPEVTRYLEASLNRSNFR